MVPNISEDILSPYGGIEQNDLTMQLQKGDDADNLDMNENFFQNISNYFSTDDFGHFIEANKNKFTCYTVNIECIGTKFNELVCFIHMLENEHHFRFDAISLQECWLPEGSDTNIFEIPGYKLYPSFSKIGRKGGLITYVLEKFSCVELETDTYTKSNLWECLSLSISDPNLIGNLRLNNIYRPGRNNTNEIVRSFLKEYELFLTLANSENYNVLNTGDVNIDLLSLSRRPAFQEYFDELTCHFFRPLINYPTRFTSNSCTLIDHSFLYEKNGPIETESCILLQAISDHQPTVTALKILKSDTTAIRAETCYKRFITAKGVDIFYRKLEKRLSETVFEQNDNTDPNINYHSINSIINKTYDEAFPLKKVKPPGRYKQCNQPWMNFRILANIKKRDQLYKSRQMTATSSPEYHAKDVAFKESRSDVRNEIRVAKKQYYGTKLREYSGDCRKTWRIIGEALGKRTRINRNCKEFEINVGNIPVKITDGKRIADEFNVFFASIGKNLSDKIKYDGTKSVGNFLTKNIPHRFNFELTTTAIVEKIIQDLEPKTSCGHDNFSAKVLKQVASLLIVPITKTINQSITTGIYPDLLKKSIVSPLFKDSPKKPNPSIFNNYRPISLLPTLGKIFEKVVKDQLQNYLTARLLLCNDQYGFRKNSCTEDAAIDLVDKIAKNLDTNSLPIAIFLDLSKAFDTLDHNILLTKLRYYGIHGISLDWFKSYLSNRIQITKYNGIYSNEQKVTTGVPQGSILGPLLFLIYINDLPNCSRIFKAVMFADDTSLTSTLTSFCISIPKSNYQFSIISRAINIELEKVNEWLKINKLSLNVSKTKFMVFKHRNSKFDANKIQILLNMEKVELVFQYNFLGIEITHDLTWNAHINKIASKISRAVGILNRLKNVLPLQALKQIYHSLVTSRIYYGNLLWGKNPKRIVILQKKCLRIITKSRYNDHIEPICKSLSILKVQDIHIMKKLCFYYRYLNNKLPTYLTEYLFNGNPLNQNLIIPVQNLVPRTVKFNETIRFQLPVVWYNTPPLIKDKALTHSYDSFKKYARDFMIAKYSSECTDIYCKSCKFQMVQDLNAFMHSRGFF